MPPSDEAAATKPRSKLAGACPRPCSSCPWRAENHGARHPGGWFTARNRDRLWSGLRRGESMSCHRTDPSNPVPEGVAAVPDGTTTHECAGGLILQQRELMKVQSFPPPSVPKYRRAAPRGLTQEGVLRLVERAMFGGVPFLGGLAMSEVDLNETGIAHVPLGSWESWAEEHAEFLAEIAREKRR